jgi:trans-AT polyketide synthase/acyltransferase/oxidoreductase domain-containing protein
MFPGQGSQYRNMGRHLLETEPTYRDCMLDLDALAQRSGGASVLDANYPKDAGATAAFDTTAVTHPAILMLEVALARLLMSKGVQPRYVLGSSLGEVAAAVTAGMLSVEEALPFVIEQARIFERRCRPGGMVAVLGEPRLHADLPALREGSELAAINCDRHFVVSAAAGALDGIEAALRNAGVSFQRLPVSHAFHSSLIDDARTEFEALQRRLPLREPVLPFISCTHGRCENVPRDGYDFWSVVRRPLDVPGAIARLERAGAVDLLDLGPSGTLANFGKRCASSTSGATFVAVMTPFDPTNRGVQSVIASYGGEKAKMKEQVAWMFPGQGSQFKGMGRELFDQFPELVDKADAILGYSIRELCLEDPQERLGQTRFTQPAIFVVNALSYLLVRRREDVCPDYLLGHSLGELSALFAAGAFDFETGLRLVKRRGELMAAVEGGGMGAVLSFEHDALAELLRSNELGGIDIANLNAPGQIVIAGPKAQLERARALLEDRGAHYIPLNVSAPFHSRYMQGARAAFREELARAVFRELQVPVISNVYARPYEAGAAAAHLEEQITSPVRWSASVGYLVDRGVTRFEEIGPGKVLTNLVAKIRRATPAKAAAASNGVVRAPNGTSAGAALARSVALEPRAPVMRASAEALGAASFRREYRVRRAYVAGAMYKGIASVALVARMAKAGYLSFVGTGGLRLSVVEDAIQTLKRELPDGETFGMNLVCNLSSPAEERALVELFLREEISVIEAAAFMHITPALVLYRARGLSRLEDGSLRAAHRVIAKVSRPEVAQQFLEPAPERIVAALRSEGVITPEQAALVARMPMADDLVVEADSGGHTDMGVALVMLPTILRQRDAACAKQGYTTAVRVGAAGGIGTPEAAAAAFLLGADFVLTGSINQCTPEAGTSDLVKDMLQEMNIQDTTYAPAGDMFEIGAKVQVLKRGVFFPARANKLFELWRAHASLDERDESMRRQIQEKYFKKSLDEVWAETKAYYDRAAPEESAKAERNPKHKMALIFRWYFIHTMRLAKQGDETQRVDFQVHCGPALGAFNQWVKGTALESWRARHVDVIADRLMTATAAYLEARCQAIAAATHSMA